MTTSRSGDVAKAPMLALLCLVQLLAMSLWFSASAVLPQLTQEWDLSGGQRAWFTMSVQLGFVVGALASALLNLADRISPRALVAASAALGAAFNLAMATVVSDATWALALRFCTGVVLAGVYPPGMKLIASWCREDRGLGIGLLVGAITLGSASPHLLNALFGADAMPPWRNVLGLTSAMAATAAVVGALLVRGGPFLAKTAPFDWRFAGRVATHTPTRLANLGYLGHMWELYAMWTWVPLFLLSSYNDAGWSSRAARFAGFGAIGIGAAGSVLAGALADRWGRTTLTMASLVTSGSCCLVAGFLYGQPGWLTAVCLIWGFAVVADSAQFSAAVSELTDSRYVGTALTVQTSLGFLLTLVTIWIIPPLAQRWGWERAFIVLALGPVVGTWAMARLRGLPESSRLASGRR